MRHASFQKGFTILELLMVISIIAVLAAIIMLSFTSFRNSSALQTTSENTISILNKARSNTIGSKDGYQYGVHFGTNDATLFRGATFVVGDSSNEIYALDVAVQVSATSFTGGGSEVLFQKFTGKTDQYGTITLQVSSDPTKTVTISIEETGVVGFQ
ncbi:MAG: hypothetical protein A2937_01170 [Candidatus Yonathbacteria bacterium RIFCSPLOWO2_01_FULL_47_33b]|uniref:General secretion pathway GspH domain-containing protein n=1 Tax=Candidatus Yonathbacteria bacterium RIFCSPLOWO2_01_FULL_47_33b TaxID=1802727 RepID=A0A1G2SHX5_9BACT|nr:MAG: hypothetical protein A2937_01170 [Candidatus Yonathbacteria bacterium RIFCSPLOWO2_01_FULL_47_33b]